MIIKGNSRGAPRQLGRHLQRTDTNGRVEILELQSPTGNLTDAFRDWQTLASGTRGKRGLYHASIDPDARYSMTPDQWQRAVEVLERELGLAGQPRAVILHEKNGRQHIHVVWQRTDLETMTLLSDSNNFDAHERASRALEQEFGHERIPGKHTKRDRKKPPPQAEFNHAEWQQAVREGIDPRIRKATITDLFQRCDSGHAFMAGLGDIGYVLARGDRRDYVLVDALEQVHSLARQINGVRAKELRAFMADVDKHTVPDIARAKSLQREFVAATTTHRTSEPAAQSPSPPQIDPSDLLTAADLKTRKEAARAKARDDGSELQARQEAERQRVAKALDREVAQRLEALDAMLEAARDRYERQHNPPKRGLHALVAKIKAWLDPDEAVREAWRKQQVTCPPWIDPV